VRFGPLWLVGSEYCVKAVDQLVEYRALVAKVFAVLFGDSESVRRRDAVEQQLQADRFGREPACRNGADPNSDIRAIAEKFRELLDIPDAYQDFEFFVFSHPDGVSTRRPESPFDGWAR
jgi:hypothetical protein